MIKANMQKPMIKGMIISANFQGTVIRGWFYDSAEIIHTNFQIKLSIGCFSWNCSRTWKEFQDFQQFINEDEQLAGYRKIMEFPLLSEEDGEDDPIVLTARIDMLNAFLNQVLETLNYQNYEKLDLFIKANDAISPLTRRVTSIQRTFRKYSAKLHLKIMLYDFYEREMETFTCLLENGISVVDLSPDAKDGHCSEEGRPDGAAAAMRQRLWLDCRNEDLALWRICLASDAVYSLPAELADVRTMRGLFLSDIGSVRCGKRAAGGSAAHGGFLLSLIGSEATFEVEVSDDFAPAPPTLAAVSTSTVEPVDRFQFVDRLRLLCLLSLHPRDRELRRRRWVRCIRGRPTQRDSHGRAADCNAPVISRFADLLRGGLTVDIAAYSPELGQHTAQRLLKYLPSLNALSVEDPSAAAAGARVRMIDLNDVAEIRPGKMSIQLDDLQADRDLAVTLVAASGVLCLPVASLSARNTVLRGLQIFVQTYRTHDLEHYGPVTSDEEL